MAFVVPFLLSVLLTSMVFAASALAVVGHSWESSITQTEAFKPFGTPWGLAFDSSGGLYVADATVEAPEAGTGAIDIFSALNVFQPPPLNDASVGATPFTGPFVRGVSVDTRPGPGQGMVYVAESNRVNVDVFKTVGGGKYVLVQEFPIGGGYMYATVDNSTNPADERAGDLYVFANGVVRAFKPNAKGELEGSGEELPGSFSLGPNGKGGLAVDPATGTLYVANPAAGAIDAINSKGELQSELKPPTGAFEPIGVGVDPSNGDVYGVDGAQNVVDQFSSAGAYLGQIADVGSGEPLIEPLAVAINAAGQVYVSDGGAKAVQIFGAGVAFAEVSTSPAAAVTKTTATLEGVVNPDGMSVTACQFEYRTEAEASFSHTIACEQSTPLTGSAPITVTAALTGLTPDTDYRYRLAATNANGTNRGHTQPFTTPAAVDAVSTGPAEEVTPNAAKLTGSLSPDGTDAHYYFEYGTTTAYGSTSPALPGTDAGSAAEAIHAETALSGLAPGTEYHYRLVAVNSFGTTMGEDATLSTPPAVDALSTGPAEEVTGHGAKLTGSLSPDGTDTHYYFEYGTTSAYGSTSPAPPGTDAGSASEAVHAQTVLSGLTPATEYHYRLVAVNTFGTTNGEDATFTTLPPPAISAEAATNLTATTADLSANVNPGGQSLTQCEFQYGTNASDEHSLPCSPSLAQIGSGSSDVAISAHLSGLQENQPYRWRVIATNASGTTTTSDHTFIYTTTGEGLPENRAYEMVTPVRKNGALLGDVFGGAQPTVAEDGSRVVLPALQCFGEATACSVNKGGAGTPYEFSRTPAGWSTQQLAPLAQQFEVAAQALTNVNEGTALLDMPSPPNGQYDFYKRSQTGVFTDIGRVTAGERGGPPWTEGPAPVGNGINLATADFSHLVFGNAVHPMWPSLDATRREGGSLYEYVGQGNSMPQLVGVSGGRESTDLLSTCGTLEAGFNVPSLPESLSADGRVVFFRPWFEPGCRGSGVNKEAEVPSEGVYARIDEAETLEVSARSTTDCSGECSTSPSAGALFLGASLAGTRVFFTSTQQLTDSASEDAAQGSRGAPKCSEIAQGAGCNLYEATLALGSAGGESRVVGLRAVSAGDVSGHGPRVQGVMAVSTDGSRVYFVARGVLSAAANDQGAVARDGAENLYVSENGRSARFIATLAETGSDSEQWTEVRANVTPDGRFLLFTSRAPLTRDDTRASGGAAQVFRYDAVSGSLVRISIGESAFNDNGNAGVGGASLASAGKARETTAGGAARTGPSLSADGSRVFFMSPIGLTRGALNDVQIGVNRVDGTSPAYAQNVYEYHEGHVSLISDGRDASVLTQSACNAEEISAVCLIGVDSTGANVFFSSADRLVSSDTDTQLDIYDARICSSGDPCVPEAPPSPAPCDGEACHGIPPVRASGAPGPTATFNGAGNLSSVSPPGPRAKPLTRAQKLAHALRACHRMHARHRRRACEAQARHRYGPLHARKAVHKRGGR
jgi:hypothetical protein